jgi:predicted nuclease of predicted toxin-antitoxin system
MKILLDECLPRHLARELGGHEVWTVQQKGWSRKTNGELLDLASRESFDVFITVDQSLSAQQNLKNYPLKVIILRAPTNKLEDILRI